MEKAGYQQALEDLGYPPKETDRTHKGTQKEKGCRGSP
jgi:hypothetical protein